MKKKKINKTNVDLFYTQNEEERSKLYEKKKIL